MPQVALSSHLVETLRNLPERPRQQVLDALEKIHHGQFDGGLRVKKLQSRPSVAVWEARVNQAARLLFTYGRHADRHSQKPVLTAHCWTVVFDHDDVPRVLQRKAFDVPDAMQWIVADEIDACEWAQPPPDNPAADLDAIERDFPETDRWDAYAALSAEYQGTLSAPPENLPWYLESPVAFAEWAEAEEVPAELILSDEQVHLLQEPLPTFLNGPAGSGKTTLALYRLLVIQENDPEADIAFVTHNPRLVAHARDLYAALPLRPEEAAPVDFKTYRELAAETMGMGVSDLQHYQVPTDRLRDFLGRHPLNSAEQQLFATDIRAVVKGMLPLQKTPALDTDVCNLLPRTIYCNEMPGTWSAVPRHKRSAVYRLAEQYQDALRSDNRLDDQDIATQALRRLLSGSKPRRYDALVLDEVQDLTEKQLRVALATLREGARTQMLLAGDPTQVLGGSGFGWRMPRAIFHERGWDPPKPYTLTRSYRASAPTLRLPEALAELLKAEEADVVSLNPDEARATGPPPVRTAPSDAVETTLAEAHPDVLILTNSEEQASRLREAWGHPLVWTVPDAKGLEADHVVLYQLPDRLIDRPGAAPAEREAVRQTNRQTLRMHYVAATRARKSVSVVAEPHPAGSIWTQEAVARTVNTMEQFRAPWAGDPSQEEWRTRADYYRDREHWAPAAECYRKAGNEAWAVLCEWLDAVLTARANGDSITPPTDAPAPWHNDDALTDTQAALLLDYGIGQRDTPLRIRLLRQVGRTDEAEALAAEHAAQTGRWREAAAYYRSHDRLAEAARLYYQGEAWEDAAACYRACQRWARAAQCYRRTNAWLDAAECHRQNKDWEEAAACYAKADAWTEAATCHRTIGAWANAAQCYREAGDDRAAAQCYRRIDAWNRAATCYEAAGDSTWAFVCTTLATHDTPDAVLSTLRHRYDPIPAPVATFLVKRALHEEADTALLAAWLLRCAERDPEAMLRPPVLQTNGTDYAITYNGGGWYEVATWSAEAGVQHEKVQGTARLPDALQPHAESARMQHENEQAAKNSLSF
ncbi:hypothetical protein CRI93_01380 [Longimonas halophila]|uniref:UvrD-like helicase ATP-binding domain-containing protein n=1 Tax=Longimonas halophila TaxID=1469170 RepID=A0A2H3P930_9BACT|nr:UvrD-helicase domain-containing protein [Longimonas halophila]PEN09405.1 hypothetical protein CRI93_01380 [Longimonas halophila]